MIEWWMSNCWMGVPSARLGGLGGGDSAPTAAFDMLRVTTTSLQATTVLIVCGDGRAARNTALTCGGARGAGRGGLAGRGVANMNAAPSTCEAYKHIIFITVPEDAHYLRPDPSTAFKTSAGAASAASMADYEDGGGV